MKTMMRRFMTKKKKKKKKKEEKKKKMSRKGAESFRLFGHDGPYKDCMGVYHEHSSETRNGFVLRSVYRHEVLPVFLYWHSKDQTWALSNTIGSSKCWMFSPDPARKPHLIVTPWKYICPNSKEWREDDRMNCEPRMDGGASRKEELLKTQLVAMESVKKAMNDENKSLRFCTHDYTFFLNE